jgi:hypothetical protein
MRSPRRRALKSAKIQPVLRQLERRRPRRAERGRWSAASSRTMVLHGWRGLGHGLRPPSSSQPVRMSMSRRAVRQWRQARRTLRRPAQGKTGPGRRGGCLRGRPASDRAGAAKLLANTLEALTRGLTISGGARSARGSPWHVRSRAIKFLERTDIVSSSRTCRPSKRRGAAVNGRPYCPKGQCQHGVPAMEQCLVAQDEA